MNTFTLSAKQKPLFSSYGHGKPLFVVTFSFLSSSSFPFCFGGPAVQLWQAFPREAKRARCKEPLLFFFVSGSRRRSAFKVWRLQRLQPAHRRAEQHAGGFKRAKKSARSEEVAVDCASVVDDTEIGNGWEDVAVPVVADVLQRAREKRESG